MLLKDDILNVFKCRYCLHIEVVFQVYLDSASVLVFSLRCLFI